MWGERAGGGAGLRERAGAGGGAVGRERGRGAGLRGEGGRGWGSGRVVGPHLYSWRRLGRSSVLRK